MKNLKRGTRILLLVAFMLGTSTLLPGSGSANFPMSYQSWDVTPAAAQGTAEGRCPDGEICKELCEIWNNGSGTVVPLGVFDCFPG